MMDSIADTYYLMKGHYAAGARLHSYDSNPNLTLHIWTAFEGKRK